MPSTAIQVVEKFNGARTQDGAQAQGDIEYFVIGTADKLDAEAALRASVPAYFGDRIISSVGLTAELAPGWWEGSAHYVNPERKQKEPGQKKTSFSTGGGSEKITHSIQTRGKYFPGVISLADMPSYHGAIGVSDDGEVEGTEIVLPK